MRIISFIYFLLILNTGIVLARSDSTGRRNTIEESTIVDDIDLSDDLLCRELSIYNLRFSKDDSAFITSLNMNKSFWSIDVGWKNYPDVITFGLSIGVHVGKNWYVVPAYCRIHPLKTRHNNFVKEGNSISTLIGINTNLEKINFIFVFGPDMYWNTSLTYGALNIGFITKLNIKDTLALFLNYRTHLTINLLPILPFEHNYLSFGISCNSF